MSRKFILKYKKILRSILKYSHVIVFLFAGLTSYAENKLACSINSNLDPKKVSKEILTASVAEQGKKDMADFCKRNMMLRYLNAQNAAPPNCETWSIEKLEAQVDKTNKSYSLWDLSLISTNASRLDGFSSFYSDEFWRKYTPYTSNKFSSIDELKRFFSTQKPEPSVTKIIESIARYGTSAGSDVGLKSQAVQMAFCAQDDLLSTISCKKSLDVIAEKTKVIQPREMNVTMTNIDLWKKVYGSDKYNAGIRLASLKIIDRANGNLPKDANIYNDCKASFIEAGMSKAEAHEATLDILGLIANGGPNTYQRAVKFTGDSQKTVGLGFIANALAYLDLKKQSAHGSLYSYPATVQTTCDNAKPYHFWMSAYLSKELKQNGFSDQESSNAVFLSQQAYQIKREVGYAAQNNSSSITGSSAITKPSPNSILTRGPFDPAHQIARTDLAYAAAGASFGTQEVDSNKSINVDQMIVKLVESSSVEKPLSKEEASSLSDVQVFNTWTKIFAPKSIKNLMN